MPRHRWMRAHHEGALGGWSRSEPATGMHERGRCACRVAQMGYSRAMPISQGLAKSLKSLQGRARSTPPGRCRGCTGPDSPGAARAAAGWFIEAFHEVSTTVQICTGWGILDHDRQSHRVNRARRAMGTARAAAKRARGRGSPTVYPAWMNSPNGATSSMPCSQWRRVSHIHLSRAPLRSRAGRPGHVASDAQPPASAKPCRAKTIAQMCRFTGYWPPLLAPWTEAASASVRDDDQPVHPCTAAESPAHARRWPRGLTASPMDMYTAAQPRHAA